ncbi:class I SAM-dependent methyltransferase [Tardiphaga sp. 841_E9_N1_2]|uniref:class I SAM-dependent methyltransferase n=1 Tax=Tardiphaga sp. 841_E9_N1_2 TaxID=3240762 RepID=UPI003F291FC2
MQRVSRDNDVSFDDLRQKWQEVPIGNDRGRTNEISQTSGADLLALLEKHRSIRGEGSDFGWYFPLYKDAFRGKRILDVGSGLGIDGMTFLKYGAHWTFSDIVRSNLDLVKRAIKLIGLPEDHAEFFYIDTPTSFLNLAADFDFIWADGSLLHIPFDAARDECHAIISRLKAGGRWIELTYPKKRWLREGSPHFSKWGEVTDGAGTQWAEWYDIEKIKRRLSPAKLQTIFSHDFYNDSCNWHDLQLLEKFEYAGRIPLLEPTNLSLSALSSCNGCKISVSPTGVEITTGSSNWSYAAMLPLRTPVEKIEVDCTVTSGSIGISFTDKDNQLVSVEKIVDAGDVLPAIVECRTPELARNILFRNTYGAGPSRATIKKIITEF